MKINWNNLVAKKLNIQYPFIQAPMLGITNPEMVASVSGRGCLGSLPLGLTSVDKALELIRAVKSKTSNAFQVNLFVYERPVLQDNYELGVLRNFYKNYGLNFPDNITREDPYTSYEELVDIIIREKIPVVSFTFGIPGEDIIRKLKSAGIVLIGTSTCVEEAKMVEEAGMDIVVAQGIEAGGHRGSFTKDTLPQVGLISLVPQVTDAVDIPVIAAGGLMQGRSIAAAFMLGAHAVQLGSAFLRTDESMASSSMKDAISSATDTSTVLTNAWSGRYARGIQNSFIREMAGEKVLPFPLQGYAADTLRQFGKQQNLVDIQVMWAGQSCRYAGNKNAGEVMSELITETERVLLQAGQ